MVPVNWLSMVIGLDFIQHDGGAAILLGRGTGDWPAPSCSAWWCLGLADGKLSSGDLN